MGGKNVTNRQFLNGELLCLEIDGSEVGATFGAAGLVKGQHIAEIKKTGAVFTIKFKKPFGLIPQLLTQPITLDCQVRKTVGAAWTKQQVEVTSYGLAGGAGAGTEDFTLFFFGTEDIVEGNYA